MTSVHPKDKLGRLGERYAADYLQTIGYTIVDRNWRCAHGELDIVCLDHGALVIVEVKTRHSTRFGDPVDAVTSVKLNRLRRLVGAWVAEHPISASALRIDVVGVLIDGTRPAIRHLKAVC